MKNKSIYILSILIAILTFVASCGGLFINNLYKDSNENILKAWYINDWVTLVLALPLLIYAIILGVKGSKRGQLFLLGMLGFCLYDFTFYLFGAALNLFFPIYVAIFSLSIFAIVFGVIELNIQEISSKVNNNHYFKFVSVYMFIWAGILGIAWLGQWLDYIITGKIPQIIIDTGGSSFLIGAIDMTFVVPVVIFASVWLWKCRAWGYILSIICNVKGAVYTIVLMAGSLFQVQEGVEGAIELTVLWIFLFSGCLLSTIVLLLTQKENEF